MLGAARIVAFAVTADAARSRGVYERVLALKHEDEFAIVFAARGVELRVQVRAFQAACAARLIRLLH